MQRSENRSVSDLFSDLWNRLIEFLLVYLTKYFFAKAFRYRLHFIRNSRVVCRQVGVIRAGINDTKGISCTGKIDIHRAILGLFPVAKVDSRNSAQGAAHLVKKSGWLPEIVVFGILSNLRNGGRMKLTVAEQTVDH